MQNSHTNQQHSHQRQTNQGPKNPKLSLLAAARPLISLMTTIKQVPNSPKNIADVRSQVIQEIKVFEEKAINAGHSQQSVIAARYCLCCALDEAVLRTSWGSQSAWNQQSLLSIIHKETWGGERFFVILDRMLIQAPQHIDFIELIYTLLSLGYEGRYIEQSKGIIEEYRKRLWQCLMTYQPTQARNFTSLIDPTEIPSEYKRRYIPIWFVVGAVITTLFITSLVFQKNTQKVSAHLLSDLRAITHVEHFTDTVDTDSDIALKNEENDNSMRA